MVGHHSLLVTLVLLVDRIPAPPSPGQRGRGAPRFYPDRLFLKALVIMIVRHLQTVHELLAVLEQPTDEMQTLRTLLTHDGRFPTRRTFERRLAALPETLPAQIGCLGRMLVDLIQPWANCGRAGSSRTPRSILRRTGPNRASMAGSMDGSCISSPRWRRSGSRWQLN